MEDTDSKDTGNTITAAIWNQAPRELINIIEAMGITLSSGDLDQLGKAIAAYVATADYYDAAGSVNAFELSVAGATQAIPAYLEGTLVRFRPNLANTGAATVDVVGLGPKSLTREDGTALASGVVTTSVDVLARFDTGADEFHVLHASIIEAGGGGTSGAAGLVQFSDGASGHDSDATLSYSSAGQALTVGDTVIDGDAASVSTADTDLAIQTTGSGELSLISGAGSENLTISSATLSYTPATQVLDVGDVAIDGNASSIVTGGGRPLTISTGSSGGALTLSSGVGGGAGDLALNAGSGGQGGGDANSIDVTSVDLQYASASETLTLGADPTKQVVVTAGSSPTVSVQGTTGHISLNATATDLQLAADSNVELSVGTGDSVTWRTADGTMMVGSTGGGAATFGTSGSGATALLASGGGDVNILSVSGDVKVEGITHPKNAAFSGKDGFGIAYNASEAEFIPVALSGSATGIDGAVQFSDGAGSHVASDDLVYDDGPKELTIDDLVINGDTASLTTADTNLSIATSGTGDLAITSGTSGTGNLSLVAGAGGINDITINSASLKWTPAIQLMNLGNITLDGDAETIATEDLDLSVQTNGAGNLNLLSGTAGAGGVLIQAGVDAANDVTIQGITQTKNADFVGKDGFGIAYDLDSTSFIPSDLSGLGATSGTGGPSIKSNIQMALTGGGHQSSSDLTFNPGINLLEIGSGSGVPIQLRGVDDEPEIKFNPTVGGSLELRGDAGGADIHYAGSELLKIFATSGGSIEILTTDDALTINTDGSGNVTIDSSGAGNTIISATGTGVVLVDGTQVLKASAALDFPSTATNSFSDLPVTVTGAALGDPVSLGVPNGSILADLSYFAWVSSADTVTIRASNGSASAARDPASGTFNVRVYT